LITIVASKSRVNPIKNRKTIPKLELCAAHLLSKLIQKVKESIDNAAKIYEWSVVTITLSWIKNGHRTDYIRRYTEVEWNHVKPEDNPADAASRGISSSDLINFDLWWNRPNCLKDLKGNWPSQSKAKEETKIHSVLTTDRDIIYNLLEKYSCIQKLKRVI